MAQRIPARKVWIVIPAYNETRYLARVLTKLQKFPFSVVVVDDGSRDQTAQVARRFTKHVLSHEVNLGKGAALKTGCDFAFLHGGAHAIVMMDGDDQHDPAELPHFLKALNMNVAVVFGARVGNLLPSGGMPVIRSLWNIFASLLLWLFFGTYIPDIPSGYKALTKAAYQRVRWNASDYTVEMEIAARVARYRLPFAVMPIKTIYHDLSKGMTLLDVVTILASLLNWKVSL